MFCFHIDDGDDVVACCVMLVQVDRLKSEGYYGGVRLLMAIYKVFYNYCKDNGIELHHTNFTLSYDTNIPRQVYNSLLLFYSFILYISF